MSTLADFVKEFLVPGSAWFLVIAASGCVVLLFGSARKRVAGRALLAALVVLYWVVSLPIAARCLQFTKTSRWFHAEQTPPSSEAVPIVVLGNGTTSYRGAGGVVDVPLPQTAFNALRAADQYHHYPESILIASGGIAPGEEPAAPEAAVIRDLMVRNGVPADRILLETTSTTTREQTAAVARMLRARGARACVVATSAAQMTRALDLFRGEGIDASPSVAESLMWAPGGKPQWWRWIVPTSEARAVSRDVIYELMAWIYYRTRGWLR